MSEFTGERVIPGLVNEDLWAEHVSRYAFAERYSHGARVLDIGSGSGYGTADLAQHASSAVGIDLSGEAVDYARREYPLGNLSFLPASALALPFADAAFTLVTAFEVIEHLADWRTVLSEARRVLHPDGVFLVSTPNKPYYAESRGTEGPNPFHQHEFEAGEFQAALAEYFPYTTILLQNRVHAFAFYPHGSFPLAETRLESARGIPENAHFFLGVCSVHQPPPLRTFVYVPRASNLLWEREEHIRILTLDLGAAQRQHQNLMEAHHRLEEHLEQQNRWALDLDQQLEDARQRIGQLQDEFHAEQKRASQVVAAYAQRVADLEQESRDKSAWGENLNRRIDEAARIIEEANATIIERTVWAQSLDKRVEQLEAERNLIRASRWVKFGRKLGVGPEIGPLDHSQENQGA